MKSTAAVLFLASTSFGVDAIRAEGSCPSRITLPAVPPSLGTSYNGIALPEVCFDSRGGVEHFFTIADWGGISSGGGPPVPANNVYGGRGFVKGVDDRAQQLVAAQMAQRAKTSRPRFVVNAGDMFYWSGVEAQCGLGASQVADPKRQFANVFEAVYVGTELADVPWLGTLGNHDYGGRDYTHGWDQVVAYTWGPGGRWVTPALYWSQRVHFVDFHTDLYFVDTNVNDVTDPSHNPNTNLCNRVHNQEGATCGEQGPRSPSDCVDWFQDLWSKQMEWLERGLAESTAEWQIVATHFPPEGDWQLSTWQRLSALYGIDLIITGHRHQQEVHAAGTGPLGATAYIVSGGGGGITSEEAPTLDGHDDQYGFMDITLTKTQLSIEAISHGGVVRSTTNMAPRIGTHTATSTSTTTTVTKTISTTTTTSTTSATSTTTLTITTMTSTSSTTTTTTNTSTTTTSITTSSTITSSTTLTSTTTTTSSSTTTTTNTSSTTTTSTTTETETTSTNTDTTMTMTTDTTTTSTGTTTTITTTTHTSSLVASMVTSASFTLAHSGVVISVPLLIIHGLHL